MFKKGTSAGGPFFSFKEGRSNELPFWFIK